MGMTRATNLWTFFCNLLFCSSYTHELNVRQLQTRNFIQQCHILCAHKCSWSFVEHECYLQAGYVNLIISWNCSCTWKSWVMMSGIVTYFIIVCLSVVEVIYAIGFSLEYVQPFYRTNIKQV